MSSLTLHCGASVTTRQDVIDSPTPPPSGSHYPVSHGGLIKSVMGQLIDRGGYEIHKETHALTKEGMRYFGLIELKGQHEDYGYTVGLMNSHDKSFSWRILLGEKVWICDNESTSATLKMNRKHTRFITRDVDWMVAKAVGKLGQHRIDTDTRIAAYKAAPINNRDVHDLIIRSVDNRTIPGQAIPAVLKEWREPSHECFQDRTMWSLFNAYTEVAKDWSPQLRASRTQALHGLFDSQLAI